MAILHHENITLLSERGWLSIYYKRPVRPILA